jgi:choline dehydrogenase
MAFRRWRGLRRYYSEGEIASPRKVVVGQYLREGLGHRRARDKPDSHIDRIWRDPFDPERQSWCQETRSGRRRASTARIYLRPALKRPNLELFTDALVHRVLFYGKRATSIEFSRDRLVERADAAREVILSAGVVGSPHILQLSGVGDPEHLGPIDLPLVHELRGVGRNMQDHYAARVSYPIVGAQTANERSRGPPPAGEFYALADHRQRRADVQPVDRRRLGQGAGGVGHTRHAVHVRARPLQERPDRQTRGDARPERRRLAGAARVARLCRGQVDMPAINPRYQSQEAERRAVIGGLRFARRMFAAPALKQFVRDESLPGDHVQTDDELLDYARRNGSTCYHASRTCIMGRHPMTVVDDGLRVRGLDGLRVIDASVMPAVTSTNTNAPTIMIAEKGAAMIKGAARQRLAA